MPDDLIDDYHARREQRARAKGRAKTARADTDHSHTARSITRAAHQQRARGHRIYLMRHGRNDRRVDASGNLPARAQPRRRTRSLLQHATVRVDALKKNIVKFVRHCSADLRAQKMLTGRRARQVFPPCKIAPKEVLVGDAPA